MNGKTNHGIYKRVLLVFVMAVLCALFAVSASAETISGECGKQGDNVTWTLDTETGTLTIAGEGEMEDYSYELAGGYMNKFTPWDKYNNEIKTLIVCDGVTSAGSDAFNHDNLTNVELPGTLKRIGSHAFSYCEKLENIEIPESVEIIEEDAFSQSGFIKITIPVNVKSIGKDVFDDCYFLERIDVDVNNSYYSSDEHGVLFDKDKTVLIKYPEGNKAEKYIMPNTVKIVGQEAFADNYYIKNIVLSDNLEVIEPAAFALCIGLQDLTFPKTLKKIEQEAFGACWSFKNIVLPENLEHMGLFAIDYCLGLESVTVNGMNTEFDEMAFYVVEWKIEGISIEEFVDLYIEAFIAKINDDYEKSEEIYAELDQYIVCDDNIEYHGTIRCHAGSTAEAYAKENGIDCELIHFLGDWVYDWDNLVRSRKCTVCDYTETEPLEKTENGGVEIVEPVDPETEFIVEEITKNGDKYAVVEKTLGENLEGDYSILKTFDITLKNKDGVHVQPDGIVKVKLPLDWDKDGDYKVYRVNDDGTLTDMEAYREGSHMVFDTDHFSVYVIVDESPEQPEEPAESEKTDSPFGFISEVIRMFKELLYKLISFFQSIGDLT